MWRVTSPQVWLSADVRKWTTCASCSYCSPSSSSSSPTSSPSSANVLIIIVMVLPTLLKPRKLSLVVRESPKDWLHFVLTTSVSKTIFYNNLDNLLKTVPSLFFWKHFATQRVFNALSHFCTTKGQFCSDLWELLIEEGGGEKEDFLQKIALFSAPAT